MSVGKVAVLAVGAAVGAYAGYALDRADRADHPPADPPALCHPHEACWNLSITTAPIPVPLEADGD